MKAQCFHYSNWVHALAGQILEMVAGQSWSSYVQNAFLGPLQMDDTAAAMVLDAKPYAGSRVILRLRNYHLFRSREKTIKDVSQSLRSSVNTILQWCRAVIKAYHDGQVTGKPLTAIHAFETVIQADELSQAMSQDA